MKTRLLIYPDSADNVFPVPPQSVDGNNAARRRGFVVTAGLKVITSPVHVLAFWLNKANGIFKILPSLLLFSSKRQQDPRE